MRARVLGSAAGGGFPQWNCGCPNCAAVRAGSPDLEPRTQDSVAITSEAGGVFLLNASPDVHRHVERTPELLPRAARHTPLAAVVLTNGDLDHCLGLLSLREGQPFAVYATLEVQAGLRERNALFRTLERAGTPVEWRVLEPGCAVRLCEADGRPSEIELTPFVVAGKVPRHLEGLVRPSPGDNVGLLLRDGRKSLAYVSAVGALDALAQRLSGVDCVLMDGTFFSSDELVRLGVSDSRAEDMAHVPVGGSAGSLAGLAGLSARRRIYTHVNNTNPMLLRGSKQRIEVESAGWEVAFDGMEIEP